MRHLTIYRLFFTESDCYKSGIWQKQRGVQVHSTGANNPWLKRYVGPDDGRLGENVNGNYHNRPGCTVCASAYVGRLDNGDVAVYQTLPWDMRCWLSGNGPNGNANRLGYIGFEIAEDKKNEEYFFDAVMDKSVLLTAHLCQMLNVEPWTVVKETPSGPALAVMDHKELHSVGIASNHGDIAHWLSLYNITMNDYRTAVEAAMEEGVEVEYVDSKPNDRPTIRRGDAGEWVALMQKDLKTAGYALEVDGKFGATTEKVLRQFQTDNGLKPDGVCGPKTWEVLKTYEEQPEPGDTVTVSRNALAEQRRKLQEVTGWIDQQMEGV